MPNHSRIIAAAEDSRCLDPVQLERLAESFRDWAGAGRASLRPSRERILLIFLLVRYTGAKLSEVLALNPKSDIDTKKNIVTFGKREVQIPRHATLAMEGLLGGVTGAIGVAAMTGKAGATGGFAVDPAFVRRKFYERAEACGFSSKLGGPEMLRKARAVELMQGDLPLPAVQRILGHSTLNLTSACVAFSESDLREVTRWHMESESGRKTSARNSFFGKVKSLATDGIQTLAVITALDGEPITAVVTNASAERLGLKPGGLVSAEVKATWLVIEHPGPATQSSLENHREGTILRVTSGPVNTECVIGISGGAELCAVVSTPAFAALGLKKGDMARVLFSSGAVILHAG